MAKLAEKRPHLQKKKILFHQNNAPSYTSAVAMAKIHELRFKMLDHPTYSADLAPSDLFSFSYLKCALRKQGFSIPLYLIGSTKETIAFENNYFADRNAEYYLDGLQRWEHRWEKCVELRGDYVEK
ncbi:histonelysine Nmethyltransferase SETMARlike [Trichonephila clavipes]|nr:histonelysine Nmethyltransferase SETMARlike [Trichonephila clavipes]